MANTTVSDELWQDFHTLVNMTSRELEEWLRTDASGPETEALPDQAGSHLGRRVLDILGKRRSDLTDDDIAVMRRVVDRVRGRRDEEVEPTSGSDKWRHGLMRMGHDPLRPLGPDSRRS